MNVPDAGAVHWSKPTAKSGEGGPLVYLAPDQEITAANAAGKVVVRDFPIGSLPFGAVGPLLGLYLTPDLEGYTEYTRPYLATLHEELIAAGQAGAAGVVFAFDVPGKQVRGYYDPHVGTLYRVPAVFVGSAQATRLKALAAQGSSARVTVRATIARKKTRNLIARLPGQELGEDRPRREHRRQLVGPGERRHRHAGVRSLLRQAAEALPPTHAGVRVLERSRRVPRRRPDPQHYPLDKKKIAFAFTIEHLGTREILPTGEGAARHLKFTGLADPALFGAGDSEVLRETAVAATKRRNLPRTAVLKGLAVPNADPGAADLLDGRPRQLLPPEPGSDAGDDLGAVDSL